MAELLDADGVLDKAIRDDVELVLAVERVFEDFWRGFRKSHTFKAQDVLVFPDLNSFQRLLVHKVAERFRFWTQSVDGAEQTRVTLSGMRGISDSHPPALLLCDLIPGGGFDLQQRNLPPPRCYADYTVDTADKQTAPSGSLSTSKRRNEAVGERTQQHCQQQQQQQLKRGGIDAAAGAELGAKAQRRRRQPRMRAGAGAYVPKHRRLETQAEVKAAAAEATPGADDPSPGLTQQSPHEAAQAESQVAEAEAEAEAETEADAEAEAEAEGVSTTSASCVTPPAEEAPCVTAPAEEAPRERWASSIDHVATMLQECAGGSSQASLDNRLIGGGPGRVRSNLPSLCELARLCHPSPSAQPRTSAQQQSRRACASIGHILEVVVQDPQVRTEDICLALSMFRSIGGFRVRWLDERFAYVVFRDQRLAESAVKGVQSDQFLLRTLSSERLAVLGSTGSVKVLPPRPATDTKVARRLLGHALGIRTTKSTGTRLPRR